MTTAEYPETMTAQEPKVLQCTEVWGGNFQIDNGVVMAGLDAWLYSQPSDGQDSGGDVHYVSSCSAGVLTRMLIADVAGHGEKVSHTAARLRQLMRRHINRHSQNSFIRAINREFAAITPSGRFATAIAMTYNAWENKLLISNAGHPAPLHYSRSRRSWGYLERPARANRDIPLGIEETEYSEFSVPVHVDDLVMVYTDCLPESRDAKGQIFGAEGVLAMMQSLDPGDPSQIVPQILGALAEKSPNNLIADDLTILVFRPNGLRPRVPFHKMAILPFKIFGTYLGSFLPHKI